MPNIPTRVAIVVDSDFSAQLEEFAGRMHVWLVNTPSNMRSAEKLWALGSGSCSRGLTIFEVDASLTPDRWVEEILNTVMSTTACVKNGRQTVELETGALVSTPIFELRYKN